jgi:hypothetical protein
MGSSSSSTAGEWSRGRALHHVDGCQRDAPSVVGMAGHAVARRLQRRRLAAGASVSKFGGPTHGAEAPRPSTSWRSAATSPSAAAIVEADGVSTAAVELKLGCHQRGGDALRVLACSFWSWTRHQLDVPSSRGAVKWMRCQSNNAEAPFFEKTAPCFFFFFFSARPSDGLISPRLRQRKPPPSA